MNENYVLKKLDELINLHPEQNKLAVQKLLNGVQLDEETKSMILDYISSVDAKFVALVKCQKSLMGNTNIEGDKLDDIYADLDYIINDCPEESGKKIEPLLRGVSISDDEKTIQYRYLFDITTKISIMASCIKSMIENSSIDKKHISYIDTQLNYLIKAYPEDNNNKLISLFNGVTLTEQEKAELYRYYFDLTSKISILATCVKNSMNFKINKEDKIDASSDLPLSSNEMGELRNSIIETDKGLQEALETKREAEKRIRECCLGKTLLIGSLINIGAYEEARIQYEEVKALIEKYGKSLGESVISKFNEISLQFEHEQAQKKL